ncbi:O-antigen ligase family protein [Geothrix oryzisoli]|uniref:O-antigen ligase family protein n=1 Tax=Geothrix oryzisoli TaxID=2922721 RepID=UPI001FACA6B6|nr:O-antigen ligase family protein [Geothrix oryzisoli]
MTQTERIVSGPPKPLITLFVILVGVSLFLNPWNSAMVQGIDTNFVPRYISLAIGCPLAALKLLQQKRVHLYIVFALLFLLWILFRSVDARIPEEAISASRYYLIGIVTFGVLTLIPLTESQIYFMIGAQIAGCAIAAQMMLQGGIDLDPGSKFRLTAGDVNGNYVAYCCVHAASLLALAFQIRREQSRGGARSLLVMTLCMTILMVGVVLPLTRGAFIGFAIVLFMVVHGYFKLKARRRVYLGYAIILLCIVGILAMSPALLARFSEGSGGDYGSDRLLLWGVAFGLFQGAPITGIGTGQYASAAFGIPTHNVFLAFLTEQGIIGFMLFMGFLYTIFRRVRSQCEGFGPWFFFLPWFVIAMTGAWERSYAAYAGFGILVAMGNTLCAKGGKNNANR